MFDVGFQEIAVILIIALIVLGPKRLPQVGRTLGRSLRDLKRASNELMGAFREPLVDDDPSEGSDKEGR
jgi:Tat protein translocase TatB subunit